MNTEPAMVAPTSQWSMFEGLRRSLEGAIIGQQALVNRLLIALLADGHLLVEGAPGLAKTRAVKALADCIDGQFHRVQFTPDLLPADLTGTEVYRPADGSFVFQQGPLFANLVLADEINRAPAKVQSALLEAMAERQITVGAHSYPLPELFLVMATQNPIEQEGTYPLPEAQLDRFLMHVTIDYPDATHERDILRLVRDEALASARISATPDVLLEPGREAPAPATDDRSPRRATGGPTDGSGGGVLSLAAVSRARREVLAIHLADNVEQYLVSLVTATREPGAHGDDLQRWVAYGASPRGTLALDACARAQAWLAGRDYVSPADVQSVIHDVLRHRVLLSFEAEADGITSDHVIDRLLQSIAVP